MTVTSVKSAERVFEILEYFARTRKPARLSEIAATLGYPISSVNSLVKCMVTLGYMKFDEKTHRYIPSTRIASVSAWLNVDSYEQMTVLEEMHRLREMAQEPVVLATPNGVYLEYVDSLHMTGGVNMRINPGARRLLVATGTGLLFLSRMERDEAMAIYRRTVQMGELRYDEFPEKAFIEKLETHRNMDVSFQYAKDSLRPTAHWGAAMISALIPAPVGHRRLAMGAHGPAARLEEKCNLITAELRRIAASLRQKLDAG